LQRWIDYCLDQIGGDGVHRVCQAELPENWRIGRPSRARKNLGFTLIFFFNSLLYNKKMAGDTKKLADVRGIVVPRVEPRGFLNVIAN
jgi:hypothetical protein